MRYWIHPESSCYMMAEEHPGDLCEEIDYETYRRNTKMAFKRVKNLTLDILKFVEQEPRYVKITGPIHLGKAQKAEGDKPAKAPANLAPVINLEDGAECQIIVAAVVLSVLNDDYPNESYVGKCFAITKKNRVPGKQYFPYGVEEIEDPTATAGHGEEKNAPSQLHRPADATKKRA